MTPERRATGRGRAEVPRRGSRPGRALPRRRGDRVVQRRRGRARVPVRGPLRRHRRRGAGAGRLRRPDSAERRDTIVSVKALSRSEGPGGSVRRDELEGPADRTRRPARVAGVGRSLARPRARRRRPARRAGHDPSAPAQARRPRWRHARRAQPRRGRRRGPVRVVDRFVELEAELVTGSEELLAGLAGVVRRRSGPGSVEREQARGRPRRDRQGRTAGGPDRRPALPMGGDAAERGEADAPDAPAPEASATSAPSDRGAAARPEPAIRTPRRHPDELGRPGRRRRGGDSADQRLVVGKTPGVTADDHVAEAGRKVMRFHLARMLAREAGVRSGKDLEDVHAMRVATRRQRAAWRVFGASFRPGRTKRYRTGLREIASRLGRRARPRRAARGGRPVPRGPAEDGAARARAAPRGVADAARRRPRAAHPRARLRRLPTLGGRLPRLRSDRGRRLSCRSARPSRIESATRRPRASGPPTSRSAGTSRSSAGPTSRRSTSCGSPASGCATRSSSCARRSATIRRR